MVERIGFKESERLNESRCKGVGAIRSDVSSPWREKGEVNAFHSRD